MLWFVVSLATGGSAVASPVAAGTTAYYNASASYIPAGMTQTETVNSNTVAFQIQAVEALVLTQDQSIIRPPGAPLSFSHVLTNSGNVSSSYTFNLLNNGPGCAADTFDLSALRVVQDSNNDGVVDAGDPVLTLGAPALLTLKPGDSAALIVQAQTPNVSTGSACLTLSVTTSLQSVSALNHDSVNLASVAVLSLTAVASYPAFIVPGSSVIQFTVSGSNIGVQDAQPVPIRVNGASTNLVLLRDVLPSGVQYVAGSLRGSVPGAIKLYRLPGDAPLTYRTTDDASAIEVALAFPNPILRNASFSMQFSTLVGASQSGTIINSAQTYFNDSSMATVASSNTVVINGSGAAIGIAQAASLPLLNVNPDGAVDGTVTLHVTVRIKNYGRAALYGVQALNLLEGLGASQFGTYTAAALPGLNQYTIVAGSLALAAGSGVNGTVLALNPWFTGAAVSSVGQNLLAADAVLPVGADVSLNFDVRINASGRSGTLLTMVRAQAALASGAVLSVFDDSVNGLDPDPDADGNPGNNASPTPIVLARPVLTLLKTASLARRVASGVYDLDYTLKVSNTGSASAPHVRLIDNLNCAFNMDQSTGSVASWVILNPPAVLGSQLLAARSFSGNAVCDRSSNALSTDLALSVVDGSRALAPGASEQVTFTVRITEKASVQGQPVALTNQAWAGSFTPNATPQAGVAAAGSTTSMLIDPQGVVYNAVTRQPVPGASITFTRVSCSSGLSGPILAAEIADSESGAYTFNANGSVTMATQADGSYQFFLRSPPIRTLCNYALVVTPPAASSYRTPSAQIPPQPGIFSSCGPVVASAMPPQVGQATTYYQILQAGLDPLTGLACEALHNHIPLDPGTGLGLLLKKEGNKNSAELGDFVDYALTVSNKTGYPITGLQLHDVLPAGFAYVAGSARMNSVASADPGGGAGPVLLFNYPAFALGVDQSVLLRYRLRVGVGARIGADAINRANASSANLQSNQASWRVRVTGGVFADEAFAFGKVYLACPGGSAVDQIGVPGVRLWMEDGSNVVTDVEGKWSLYGLTPMTHVLRVDETTLPKGARLDVLDNRNAKNPASRFLDLKKGEFHQANFVIGNCTLPMVLADVAARRQLAATLPDADGAALVSSHLDPQGKPSVLGDTRALPAAGQATRSGAVASSNVPSAALITLPLSSSALTPALGALPGNSSGAPAGGIGAMGSLNPLSGVLQPRAAPLLAPVTPQLIDLEHAILGLDNSIGFIGLKDGDTVASQAVNLRVKGSLGLDLLLSVNGVAIESKRVGKKAVLASSSLSAWEYIGVRLQPGSNDLLLRLMDPFGNQRGSVQIKVIAPDQLSRIEIVLPDTARADGHTPVPVQVRLSDAAGVLVTARTQLTLEADRGRWLEPDLNPNEIGTQVFIEGGQALFHLIAPGAPGDARVRVAAGAFVSEARLALLPELRPMIGVGMLEGGLDLSRRGSLNLGQMPAGAAFETELSSLGGNGNARVGARSAFFFKGAVKGDYLLTAALDSAKSDQQPLFRDISPDQYYPIYGDSSVRGFDAQSTQKLYVRIDKNRSYLLYGDFTTSSSSEVRQLSQSNRSLTGVKQVYDTGSVRASSYAALTSQTRQIEEFPATGVSGPFFLSGSGALIPNSESIELLVRDRRQANLVLQTTSLVRFVDYSIEPLTRRILFTHALASLDPNLNPQSIRVTYEVDHGGAKFIVAGSDVQVKVTDHVQLGLVVSTDQNLANARQLQAATGLARIGADTTMAAEVVRTQTDLLGQGAAARVELRHQDSALGLVAQVVKSTANFDNPGATLSAGHTEAVLRAEYKIDPITQLRGEALASKNEVGAVSTHGVAASVQRKLSDTVVAEVGLRHGQNSSATASMFDYSQVASANGASASNGAISATSALSAASVSTDANHSLNSLRARLTAQVPFLPQAQAFLEGEQDLAHGDRHMLALGGNYAVSDQTRLYARYELLATLDAPSLTQTHNVGLFGVESTYMPGGRVYNEYRMADALDGRSGQNALGVRNSFKLSPEVSLTAGLERSKGNGASTLGNTGDATAIISGADYVTNNVKLSGVLEARQASDANTYLSTFGLGYKFNSDWSLLARSTLTDSDGKGANAGNARFLSRQQIGVAYRPVGPDIWNALARFEHKIERIEGGGASAGAVNASAFGSDASTMPGVTAADIVSTHLNFNPARGTSITGRYAAKLARFDDGTLKSTYWAHLLQGRYSRDLNVDWDVGLQAGLMLGQGGARQKTAGLELGYQMAKDMWLSVGYNVVGFSDPDLTAGEYASRGVYLRLRMKFDESRFGFPALAQSPGAAPTLGPLPAKTVWYAEQLFEARQPEILLTFRDTLDQVGPRLGIDQELLIEVQGANALLAARRAAALLRYLIAHGVAPSQIRLTSEAAADPTLQRVEITVIEDLRPEAGIQRGGSSIKN